MYNRYWHFNVYEDCSVEFVASWGDPLDLSVSVRESSQSSANVYPNPFSDRIIVVGLNPGTNYIIHDALGQTVRQGFVLNGMIGDLGDLECGIYGLSLFQGDSRTSIKLIRE